MRSLCIFSEKSSMTFCCDGGKIFIFFLFINSCFVDHARADVRSSLFLAQLTTSMLTDKKSMAI